MNNSLSRSTNRPSLSVVIVVELFPDGCGLGEEGMVWREEQEIKTKMKHGVERRGTWSVGSRICPIWVPAFGTLNNLFWCSDLIYLHYSILPYVPTVLYEKTPYRNDCLEKCLYTRDAQSWQISLLSTRSEVWVGNKRTNSAASEAHAEF